MGNQVLSLSARMQPQVRPSQHKRPRSADTVLRLLSRLQTTLDPVQVMRIYFDEMQGVLQLEGMRWQCRELSVDAEFGRAGRVRYVCRLSMGDECFGELALSRREPPREADEALFEQTLALLIHPLRNAVMYQRALAASRRDALTGLANRAALDEALPRELELARRHDEPVSLLLLDIDRFKEINDSYGHSAGDAALRVLAEVLMSTARQSDLLFRYAGDEFVIVMSRTNVAGATVVAERLCQAVAAREVRYGEHAIPLRISVGVATGTGGESAQSLFERADQALFSAKREGRARVGVAA